jgi:hypothetical protein
MCWTPPYTRHKTKTNKIHNTICVGHHLCLVYGGVQHILCCVFYFVCLRLVPCVWWCPTHIVLCILLCLSSSCALCMDTICVGHHHTQGTRRRQTKYTTQYVLDTTIHKAQDEDKQSKIHNTICVGHHHTQGTRRRRVVYFTLFVFVLCLVYGGVQHILCCVLCFDCLRLVPCVWWCPTHIVLCILLC